MRGKILSFGILIVVIASGLAGADWWFKERPALREIAENTAVFPPPEASSSSVAPTSSSDPSVSPALSGAEGSVSSASSSLSSSSSSSSSSPRIVKKGISTKKKPAVNVDDVFRQLTLTAQQTSEASFLGLAAPHDAPATTVVLLKDSDRAFLFSWLENNNVKAIFSALKQSLQTQFSINVTDLKDETQSLPSGPIVDVLSFLDPALSSERLIFLHVRTRLYEIHVAKNGEAVVNELVAALSM